ncbi:uncharacterized protein DUF4309 [Scopulibacillus darangshiensis]|uniref:Uncharacterized protein DUF4309 n=1 Tax=Scopulibacillus darangshiensis TaxID=442528 RepID=A0A4R2NJT4_9BACL|nr:uncharacterized protein DUF4309 [Scopulibacillus darangshiensis]
MPGNVQDLKINKSTKKDVHNRLGNPEKVDGQFDLYSWEMGQPGYGFAYNEDNTISEIRNFGTGVERQTNLGGITPDLLGQQLGIADKILKVPGTDETDYVYNTGDYELHFVIGDNPIINGFDQTVNHVNLTTADTTHISSGTAAAKYLRHQLKMDNNHDIAFSDMGGDLKTDKSGSYYTIKLTSRSMQKKGGTGTVGLYKVYQDGAYKSEY